MLHQEELKALLQLAYSAERAAAFAFQGHAKVMKSPTGKAKVQQIEQDEWEHRAEVLKIMNQYSVPISKWLEIKYAFIGKMVSWSCLIIGWFMATYFAARLESGNVNEYFRMKELFNSIDITEHDDLLIELGMKEKEHEVFFGELISKHKWLPFFQKVFKWSPEHSFNDV